MGRGWLLLLIFEEEMNPAVGKVRGAVVVRGEIAAEDLDEVSGGLYSKPPEGRKESEFILAAMGEIMLCWTPDLVDGGVSWWLFVVRYSLGGGAE